jgi:hypothetical protein
MGYINPESREKTILILNFFFTATILNWQNLLEIETHKDILSRGWCCHQPHYFYFLFLLNLPYGLY